MKKALILILVFLIPAIGHAQQAGQVTIGVRVGPVFGVHNAVDLEGIDIYGTGTFERQSNVLFNFNFTLYVNYAIANNFLIQAEANVMLNQGYELRMPFAGFDSRRGRLTYTSLDIPILLRYNFLDFPLAFGVQAGPHISVPLGQGMLSGAGFSQRFDIDTFATFGLTTGFFSGTPVGPGRIVGDLRFIVDFNALEAQMWGTAMHIMRRRAFVISLGYEVTF